MLWEREATAGESEWERERDVGCWMLMGVVTLVWYGVLSLWCYADLCTILITRRRGLLEVRRMALQDGKFPLLPSLICRLKMV